MTAPRRTRRASTGGRPVGRNRHGFVLIGVLIALGLTALAAVQTGQRLIDSRRRDSEAELLFVGEQYRQAIASYGRATPGGVRRWPTRLEDLLEDRRFPQPRRHLRKLYPDPLSPESPWGLLNQGSAVIGVYSQAPGTPFRQTGFGSGQRGFENAQTYADWRFVADLPLAVAAPGTPPKPTLPGNGGSPPPLTRGKR